MPHQIIEYSANLDAKLDMRDLVMHLHNAAAGIDGLPLGGLRTRAARRENYRVADGHVDNAFVHLTLKLGHGRTVEKRQEFGSVLFAALCDFLQPVSSSSPLAISFEIQEIDPTLTWKKNNLRDYMSKRES